MKPTYVDFAGGGGVDPVTLELQRTVLVVVALADGPLRLSQAKRLIGHIGQQVLTATLRALAA